MSGGQTGVDRGTLDAALDAGFPCGGWCPERRMAEDGALPERYPLATWPGAGYEERTLKNVLDSDGTAVLYFRELEGGTRLTRDYCIEHRKPCEAVDASRTSPREAADRLAVFIAAHGMATLNVAGPRASKWPGARDYAYATVTLLLESAADK